ncbi:phosphatase PAP2 family protein [Streptomyces sp. RFCAC02]|uniref:phosphatase PAP2 family protein n=1 Tax=Streptomyces sp. RFCAC02 TaxID=2499143 RepID=UPI001F0F4ED8|nr:phosphatase PAP2 family protein [Streptomyces sp. RFCAC02]
MLKRVLTARKRPALSPRPPLVRELLLVTALYLAYKFGRRVANGQFADAYDNAHLVWDLERALHLPSEGWVQDLLMHSEPVIRFINVYYATVHFPAMLVFLVWMYWRRPGHYLWVRWVLTWLTAAALVLHLLVPLAPPRLFRPSGLLDTGRIFGPAVYGKPEADSMANQFAAMPSLHVGWALVIAIALIVSCRSRLRWLWLLHPAITVLAVVSTGHHYWMDGIVAATFLALILAVLRPPRRAAPADAPPTPAPAERPAVAAVGGTPRTEPAPTADLAHRDG